jgi:hypothetical protein
MINNKLKIRGGTNPEVFINGVKINEIVSLILDLDCDDYPQAYIQVGFDEIDVELENIGVEQVKVPRRER